MVAISRIYCVTGTLIALVTSSFEKKRFFTCSGIIFERRKMSVSGEDIYYAVHYVTTVPMLPFMTDHIQSELCTSFQGYPTHAKLPTMQNARYI